MRLDQYASTFIPGPAGAVFLQVMCVRCAEAWDLPLSGVQRLALDRLLAPVKHDCPVPLVKAPAPTPRDDKEMTAFIAMRLAAAPGEMTIMADAHDVFCAHVGRSVSSEVFSRRLRRALPPGAVVRREMINGVRANRLIGMRITEPF